MFLRDVKMVANTQDAMYHPSNAFVLEDNVSMISSLQRVSSAHYLHAD